MDEKLKERLQKLQNLAERGVGGEKETAEKKLQKLLAENNLTEVDLQEDKVNYYLFSFKESMKKRLLYQIIYKVVGTEVKLYHTKGTRNKVGTYCTAAEKLEIDLDFEFYSNILDQEFEIFMSAFITKQDLFPKDVPVVNVNIHELTQEQLEELNKKQAYLEGITHRTRSKMIEQKEEQ